MYEDSNQSTQKGEQDVRCGANKEDGLIQELGTEVIEKVVSGDRGRQSSFWDTTDGQKKPVNLENVSIFLTHPQVGVVRSVVTNYFSKMRRQEKLVRDNTRLLTQTSQNPDRALLFEEDLEKCRKALRGDPMALALFETMIRTGETKATALARLPDVQVLGLKSTPSVRRKISQMRRRLKTVKPQLFRDEY
jgi:hypothetical protein